MIGVINTRADITIMGGELFARVAAAARLQLLTLCFSQVIMYSIACVFK